MTASAAASRPESGAWPIPLFERLQIESQALCNRSCWFCPRTYDRSGAYLDGSGRPVSGRMPTRRILDLLDQSAALGFRGRVEFFHYSEPLLDKRAVRLGEEARRRGLRPTMHTNGDVLERDVDLCRAVSEAYDLVVIGLYDYRTAGELEERRRWWSERLAGVDLAFSTIGADGRDAPDSMAIPRALVPTDRRMSVPDLTFPNAPCHRPLIRMLIRHDGQVCNCCEDLHASFGLGNVFETSLAEAWFSERHVEVVRRLLAGRREDHPLCRNCPLPPTAPDPGGAPVRVVPRSHPSRPHGD